MTQPAFAFHVEPVTPQETRQAGRQQAHWSQSSLWVQMLAIYAQGPRTDAEMALLLGVERTTVNARRDDLVRAGKVRSTGTTRRNPKSGVANILWGLTNG